MSSPMINGVPTLLPRLEKERVDTLARRVKGEIGVLYSEKNVDHSKIAGSIASYLRTLNGDIKTHLIRYDYQSWVERAKEAGVSLFVFLGMPASRVKRRIQVVRRASGLGSSSSPEEEYMSKVNRKLSDVVVLLPNMPTTKLERQERQQRYGVHYLDRFLSLDLNLAAEWLSEAALAVFTAPQPKACEDDFAYWSQEPKLVEVWKEGRNSLGLSIMTREMAKASAFARIVLIKGFNEHCLSELPERLGKYTHIQAVNGIFLDGLPIENVTEIFRNLTHPYIQLLVRYIHPTRRQDAIPLSEFPERHSMYNPQRPGKRLPRTSIDTTLDPLPIPLFILGDNFLMRNTLFQLLQADDLQSPGSNASPKFSLYSPTSANFTSSNSSSQNAIPSPSSVPEDEKEDVATPLRPVPPSRGSKRHKKDSMANSDDYILRARVPDGKFEIDTRDLPDLNVDGKDLDPETPVRPPRSLPRQVSHPPIAQREYILHMFTQKVDRQFAHLFLKPSGIYLIVIALDDILGDPLIQYENLFNWLRLIHTHVWPDEIRRVIIVGMYQKSQVHGDSLKCVQHLNTALRDQTKQTLVIPTKEKGYVFMFNLDQAQTEIQYLCTCIRSCMDVFIDRSWCFEKQFFDYVFTPFNGFRNVCSKLMVKRGMIESSQSIGKLYDADQLPERYFETLAAYAPAFISTTGGDCILKPAFIAELLQTCLEKMTDYDNMVFALPNSALSKLPVITSQLLEARMSAMGLGVSKHRVVISWMKELELIYSIGSLRRESDIFFVPFLATEAVSEQIMFDWNEGVVSEFDNALILYAQLSILTTDQFFHRLIASLLKDSVATESQKIWINAGCKEAVLPLHEPHSRVPLGMVLLRYHPIQNIIEFRLRTSRPLLLLKAAEAKLAEVYRHSKYSSSSNSFKGAVSFHIPAPDFDPTVKEGAIWKLGNVGVKPKIVADDASKGENEEEEEEEEEDVDRPDKVLLRTRPLTTPGNLDTTKLRAWASSEPEMKVLPPNLYLYLQKLLSSGEHWAMVGSKLGLLSVDDINFFRDNPVKGGNGGVLLDRWKESSLTYTDLVDALKATDVGMNRAAKSIENYFCGENRLNI